MRRICLYAGSFDPMTVGHLNIVERLCAQFDHVIVAICKNAKKPGYMEPEAQLRSVTEAIAHLRNAEAIQSLTGLTVDLARKHGATVLARGLRSVTDFEYEANLAQFNAHVAPDIETMFLLADPKVSFISSSGVRTLHALGASIQGLVPPAVESALCGDDKQGKEK